MEPGLAISASSPGLSDKTLTEHRAIDVTAGIIAEHALPGPAAWSRRVQQPQPKTHEKTVIVTPVWPLTALKIKRMIQTSPQIFVEAFFFGDFGATTRRCTRPVF